MSMTRFLVRKALIPSLVADTRDEAIREMVASLADAGAIERQNAGAIADAIFRREQLGTTGIGNGLAIPHSRHPSVDVLIGTLAVFKGPAGIEFNSHDGQPVFALVLIISPQDQPGPHLRALDSVVAAFRDETLIPRLQSCQTADDMWAVLTQA